MSYQECTPKDVLSILKSSPLENLELLQLVAHWEDFINVRVYGGDNTPEHVAIRYSPPPTATDQRTRLYLSAGGVNIPAQMVGVEEEEEILVCAQTLPMLHALQSRYAIRGCERDRLYLAEHISSARHAELEVLHLTIDEARQLGIGEQWEWEYVVGRRSGVVRPVHCIIVSGAAVAWAIAGMPTEVHEEVRAVFVQPAFRGKGYGKAVVLAVCAEILKAGRKPVYVTADDNTPSIKLAEAVGMTHILTISRLLVNLKVPPRLTPLDTNTGG